MTFDELGKTVKHIKNRCLCTKCGKKYKNSEIAILATTDVEGIFETHCEKCKCAAIISVVLTPNTATSRTISQNDILDIKNFLSSFDGNFKKIFSNQK